MAHSIHYKALSTRVLELRRRFLPARFSRTGSYTTTQLDMARAFRILSHAELEYYFEARALDIATRAYDLWKNRNKATAPMICLLTNIIGDSKGLPSKLGTNITSLHVSGRVYGQYKHAIINNNGIKTPNLLNILLPISVLESDIDSAWLSTIDGFGAKRGETAHTAAVYNQIDPQDDYQTVMQIMSGIRDVDVLLNNIRGKCR